MVSHEEKLRRNRLIIKAYYPLIQAVYGMECERHQNWKEAETDTNYMIHYARSLMEAYPQLIMVGEHTTGSGQQLTWWEQRHDTPDFERKLNTLVEIVCDIRKKQLPRRDEIEQIISDHNNERENATYKARFEILRMQWEKLNPDRVRSEMIEKMIAYLAGKP